MRDIAGIRPAVVLLRCDEAEAGTLCENVKPSDRAYRIQWEIARSEG